MFTPFVTSNDYSPLKVQTTGGTNEPESLILLDFYTVANAGNISKAAKELYISQPAISKSIQKLEDGLECKLFPEAPEVSS